MYHFHPPKFLMNFFSHRLKNLNFPPYFRYFNTFPPISRKFLFLSYFSKSPLFSSNLRVFTYFMCFSFSPSLTMMHLCTYWTPLPLCTLCLYVLCLTHAIFNMNVSLSKRINSLVQE